MAKSDEEIRKEWGYEGKPKQWQQGFDCGLKEIRLAESEKDSKYEKLVARIKRLPEFVIKAEFCSIESLITEIEGGVNDKAEG